MSTSKEQLSVIDHEAQRVLELLPQRPPFRFVDEILEMNESSITGAYRFREDEWFYQGHFPGQPITPGVILIEAMAQTGIVALGIYLSLKNGMNLPRGEEPSYLTLFTRAEVEFLQVVKPGTRVIVKGEKIYFRRQKLACKVSMEDEHGKLIASGELSGMGVLKEQILPAPASSMSVL